MANGTTGGGIAGTLGPIALIALMLAWLWPIGPGGAMPVGGDVTQFQVGLMATLGESLREGRLPFWNDRWGFGFPGVAESQMGVYYPPHLLAFGLLPVETAYTVSLVVHVLWGALGACWLARIFGTSGWGAFLSGGAWAASGFFLIHLPHQWAYTVGSWTPWAWGLAWLILSGRAGRLAPWLLSATLAIQILPGHFQLAFCTQVSLIVLAIGAVLAGSGHRGAIARRSLAVVAGLIGAFALAGCQVVPTFELARLAETQRDYEYLSGFAATPVHLVNLVAPDLFHRSPLWRPVAWDPFHTSPEELRLYVGLIPAWLALVAIARPGGRGGAIGALAIVLGVGLLLSLGPYVPGFRTYSQWPGFSFFRAPARWGMVVSLAMAVLAGLGLDVIREGRVLRPGRWLAAFVLGAALWIGSVIGLFELGLREAGPPGSSAVATAFDRLFDALPWDQGPPAAEVFAGASRPQSDLRVVAAQAREGLGEVPASGLRLDRERASIYRAELETTAALLLLAIALTSLSGNRHAFAAGLVLLTVADLGLMARRRPVDEAPLGPLIERSPVLARLGEFPEGTRTLDPMRNLPMVSGASPVQSYRTLDLPVRNAVIPRADLIPRDRDEADLVLDAQRALGARVRVIGPIGPGIERLEGQFSETERLSSSEVLDDPDLTTWLLGAGYAATEEGRAGRYLVLDAGPAPRAWFLPIEGPEVLDRIGDSPDASGLLSMMIDEARPLELLGPAPERRELSVSTDRPGVVLLTQLDHPGWAATLAEGEGRTPEANPAEIVGVLGGWQAVAISEPGQWTLRLRYEGRAERIGLILSACCWAGWALGAVGAVRRSAPHPEDRAGADPEGSHPPAKDSE